MNCPTERSSLKPEIKKLIIAKYKQMLKAHQLPYKQVKVGVPHRSIFECDFHPDMKLYIFIAWVSYDDQFMIEVGWAYKLTLDDVSSIFDPVGALDCDAACVGLTYIAGQKPETCWDVRACYRTSFTELSDTNNKFVKLMEDSFQSLLEIGIPYLARVIATKLPAGFDKPRWTGRSLSHGSAVTSTSSR